jgi:hypothetical protein
MNIPIIHSIAYSLVFLLIASPAISAELYRWVDERGTVHLTDNPPDKPGKILGRDTYRDPAPGEIRENQEQERSDQTQSDIERDLFLRNQAAQQAKKEAELRKAKDYLNQAEKDLDLHRERARHTYQNPWVMNYYEQIERDKEQVVEESRRRVRDLENR